MLIAPEMLRFLGAGLSRPECVLAHRSGAVFTADWTASGGVAILHPDGSVRRILARDPSRPLRPNGIAFEPSGTMLVAHLGAEEGGIFRLSHDGTVEPVLTELAGRPLPPTNYVHRDPAGRLWISISTTKSPRHLAYRRDVADGFIVCFEDGKARVACEELGYANECLLAPDGAHLYVNETFARRLSRFALGANGGLGPRETVTEFGHGTFPDGLTFASDGSVWVTSIVSNRLIRVGSDGNQSTILADADEEHVARVEQAFQSARMGRPHLDTMRSRQLRNISSLAFGGPSLTTAYLGCLLGQSVAVFDSPIAGFRPAHYDFPLTDILSLLPPASPEGNTARPHDGQE